MTHQTICQPHEIAFLPRQLYIRQRTRPPEYTSGLVPNRDQLVTDRITVDSGFASISDRFGWLINHSSLSLRLTAFASLITAEIGIANSRRISCAIMLFPLSAKPTTS